MAEFYEESKKERLFRQAISLYNDGLKMTDGRIGDSCAIYTMCIALCIEHLDEDEEVRNTLNVIGKNCYQLWRDLQELKDKYNITE